jgi:hypothetical protein
MTRLKHIATSAPIVPRPDGMLGKSHLSHPFHPSLWQRWSLAGRWLLANSLIWHIRNASLPRKAFVEF